MYKEGPVPDKYKRSFYPEAFIHYILVLYCILKWDIDKNNSSYNCLPSTLATMACHQFTHNGCALDSAIDQRGCVYV